MAKRASKLNSKTKEGPKTEVTKAETMQIDRFTHIFGFIGLGFAIGVFIAVLLVYAGIFPTKIDLFGIDFDLSNYCTKVCSQQATAIFTQLPTPTSTLAPTSTSTYFSTSTITLTPGPMSAVEFVDQYYSKLNHVEAPSELNETWRYLSKPYQCQLYSDCLVDGYISYWWKYKVTYELFACKIPSQVNVRYTLYKRFDKFLTDPVGYSNIVIKYYVGFNDLGEMEIISSVLLQNTDYECKLQVSRLTPVP